MYGRSATQMVAGLAVVTIAVGFIGPALLACGTPELRAEYLPRLYRGDLVMCQLFSEPNAGSDLASARTRAERDDDEWLINGQKVDVERARRQADEADETRPSPSRQKDVRGWHPSDSAVAGRDPEASDARPL